MASSISAGTTSSTALVATADTTGALVLQTNNGTTALTLSTAQNATFAGTLTTTAQGIAKASLPAGSVLQVVNGYYNTEVSTASTSDTDTGLTATITPLSSTSKIIVLVSQKIYANTDAANNGGATVKLFRGATNLITAGRVGLSDGTGAMDGYFSTSYLDSPSSTSALTYKTTLARYGGAGTVFAQLTSCPAGITLMEVAA
jgi:hypothetical protein